MDNGEKRPRVRFAPSPTGVLHLGSARTALFNWLFARRFGGEFVIRIEDTDRERSSPVWERAILEDLRSLGLFWDEGPQLGGPYGPYRQSERLPLYIQVAEELETRGYLYRCYCTPEELTREREAQLARGEPPRYSRRCLNISSHVRARLMAERAPALRVHVADAPGEFTDVLRGRIPFAGSDLGDFIAVKSDGWPSYNFAAAVDDHVMGITHIIRGEEHLPNTPRQVIIYRALGWEPPRFFHVGLVLGPDGSKLSKRHGAASVAEHLAEGILPGALLNFLGLLGWTHPSGKEIYLYPLDLASDFLPERLSRGPAVFDRAKLLWVNRRHLRELSPGELVGHVWPRLAQAGFILPGEVALRREWLELFVEAAKEGAGTLEDFSRQAALFLGPEPVPGAGELGNGEARESLKQALQAVGESPDPFGLSQGRQVVTRLREGAKRRGAPARSVLSPLRLALTGSHEGPELPYVLVLLGKDRAIARLKRALDLLGGRA